MGESPTIEPLPAEVELRLQRHEPIRFRAWFYPFIALLAVLAAVKVSRPDTSLAILAAYLAYMSICCTFCPLPTTPAVLWMAAPAAGGGLGLDPLAVAALGAVGTAIANMHDYYLLTFLYRYRPVRRVRTTGLYKRFAAWYNRAPFATLAAASFLPIPVDFVRLLAISEGYSRARFALGSLVGRWPRYLLLAYLAERFDLGWQWVLGIGGATVVLGLWRGLPALAQRLKGCFITPSPLMGEGRGEGEKGLGKPAMPPHPSPLPPGERGLKQPLKGMDEPNRAEEETTP